MIQQQGTTRPLRGRPTTYFCGLLTLLVLAACAAYAAGVLATASWPEVAALRGFNSYDWHREGMTTFMTNEWVPRRYTAGEFAGLRAGLAGLALVAGLLGGGLGLRARGRAELAALGGEIAGVLRSARRAWWALAPRQRRGAGLLLVLLLGLRGYYSLVEQPFDDATSFELFVRRPLLVVGAVYPYPNNHVLSNSLSWVFYQLYPGFWWSMRLPVLLTGAGALGAWFLLLLRRANFTVALVASAWFGLLSTSLNYAAMGRGYCLTIGLGALGFYAVLVLQAASQAPNRLRLAWVALVLSGILGLYTVPTHAFFLASAYGWLGWQAAGLRAGRWRQLGTVGALGALTLVGAGLLYAPVLLVSGPGLLLRNQYVRPLVAGEFWPTLLATAQLPHHLAALPLVLAVLAGFGLLWWRGRAGRLSPARWQLVRRLGLPALWFVLLPYALAIIGQIEPPERTFFYKAQYLFILMALVVDWALGPAQRWRRWALGLSTLLFAGSQLWQLERLEAMLQQSFGWQLTAPVIDWLATQPAGPLLAPQLVNTYLLRFYAHKLYPTRTWQIDARPRPGVRYRYFVRMPAASPQMSGPAGPPVFRNALMQVQALP